jgi:hypothetical protein
MATDRTAYHARYHAEHQEERAAYFKQYAKNRADINRRNAAWMKRNRKAQKKVECVKGV